MSLLQLERVAEAQNAIEEAYQLREGTRDGFEQLYRPWTRLTLAQGLNAMLVSDLKAFEQAGLKYIDIMEKAEDDDLGQVVEDALADFIQGLKTRKDRKAFEELKLFIDLMKIKDPFEGWRALGKAVSARWPKGVSAVKAVREIRR